VARSAERRLAILVYTNTHTKNYMYRYKWLQGRLVTRCDVATGELPGEAYAVSPSGLDRVELLLAAGPAEPLRSLGGESARLMLALKAAPILAAATAGEPAGDATSDAAVGMSGADGTTDAIIPSCAARPSPPPQQPGFLMIEDTCGHSGIFPLSGGGAADATAGRATFDGDTSDFDGELSALGTPVVILDEIDAGVGARLGHRMARMLHAMARGGQILAVSHVPQARRRFCVAQWEM
jgi:hypothetical protein